MGVESDRLVFDYLSRVGDLAQALPAAQRMKLVSRLRTDIDKERGRADSPAAVQRILGRLGSPDEVVDAAAGSAGDAAGGGSRRQAPEPEPPSEPGPGSYGPYERPRPEGSADGVPRARKERDGDGDQEWRRTGPRGSGRLRAGDELAGLPGMTGEVFIPFDDEDLDEDDPVAKRVAAREAAAREVLAAEEAARAEEAEKQAAEGAGTRRRRLPRLRRGAREGGRRWGSPLLLLAAALLVAGTVIGSWIPLLLGWGAGYLSRQLTRTQAKFAVLGIPGCAAAGLVVWLWGRDTRHWSTPIAQGQMNTAFRDALPVAVRVAAVASALYFLWRSRRSA